MWNRGSRRPRNMHHPRCKPIWEASQRRFSHYREDQKVILRFISQKEDTTYINWIPWKFVVVTFAIKYLIRVGKFSNCRGYAFCIRILRISNGRASTRGSYAFYHWIGRFPDERTNASLGTKRRNQSHNMFSLDAVCSATQILDLLQ